MQSPLYSKISVVAGATVFHLILIAALGVVSYSNTLNAPFQWDESFFIAENPIVKDINYFFEPSKAKGFRQYGALKSRTVGFLTFALNYKLHGLDVRGYHIFNIAVHLLNAFLVYFLVVLTFKTPFLSDSTLKGHSRYIAVFSALLFVSHPIQTEAVTYIFQRLASLAALFYLMSLVFYIKWRLTPSPTPLPRGEGARGRVTSLLLYLASLISAVLAMKTKENAFTLPVVIALYEFSFFRGSIRRRVMGLVPIFLTMLIIPLSIIGASEPSRIISSVDALTRGTANISRMDYLLTQFRVAVTYIRLLVLPINQNLDYDYPVFSSFLNFPVFLSFVFLLSCVICAAYMFYISRFRMPDLRLTAFGVFWFFITLSIESSIIPLAMVINEYRVYLPSVGFIIGAVVAATLLAKQRKGKIRLLITSVFVLIALAFSYASYSRNALWGGGIRLWEDIVRKSPMKPRVHHQLGNYYLATGQLDRAIAEYRVALRLKPDYADAYNNLANAYGAKGLSDRAIEMYEAALSIRPDSAETYNNLGTTYYSKGLYDRAILCYEAALSIRPDFAEAYNNMGIAYEAKGLNDKAIGMYKAALRLKPEYAEARYNLEVITLKKEFSARP